MASWSLDNFLGEKGFSTVWTLILPNMSCISKQFEEIQEVLSMIVRCEVQYDLDKPRIAVCKNTWRIHQNTVSWCNLKLTERKGLQFYQSREHTVALSQQTTCDLYWESGKHEDWRGFILQKDIHPQGYRASYSRQICNMDDRIRLIPMRENPPTISRSLLQNTRRKHPGESILHLRQMHAAVGKESTVEQGWIRRLVSGNVIKKNSTHGARHGSSMRQCMYHKAHEMLKKARKHKNGYRNILDRWNKDDKYRKSLSDVRWPWRTYHSIRWNRIGRPFLHCNKRRRKSERETMETSIECRGKTRTTESAQWLKTSEADMQKTVPRAYSNHWKWKQTYAC